MLLRGTLKRIDVLSVATVGNFATTTKLVAVHGDGDSLPSGGRGGILNLKEVEEEGGRVGRYVSTPNE
jgi:hypothetical protein